MRAERITAGSTKSDDGHERSALMVDSTRDRRPVMDEARIRGSVAWRLGAVALVLGFAACGGGSSGGGRGGTSGGAGRGGATGHAGTGGSSVAGTGGTSAAGTGGDS